MIAQKPHWVERCNDVLQRMSTVVACLVRFKITSNADFLPPLGCLSVRAMAIMIYGFRMSWECTQLILRTKKWRRNLGSEGPPESLGLTTVLQSKSQFKPKVKIVSTATSLCDVSKMRMRWAWITRCRSAWVQAKFSASTSYHIQYVPVDPIMFPFYLCIQYLCTQSLFMFPQILHLMIAQKPHWVERCNDVLQRMSTVLACLVRFKITSNADFLAALPPLGCLSVRAMAMMVSGCPESAHDGAQTAKFHGSGFQAWGLRTRPQQYPKQKTHMQN